MFDKMFAKVFGSSFGPAFENPMAGGAIVRFWAAWADAAGVNQTLFTGTGPVTTDHPETFYALGSDGEYDAYTANQPVWQYDADGDYLVAQDEGTNLIPYSVDLSSWTLTATAAEDVTHLNGTANGAYSLEDTTTGVSQDGLMNVLGITGSVVTYKIWVEKDEDETRFPEFYTFVSGVTINSYFVQLNTKTGATAVRTQGLAGNRHEIIDDGDNCIIILELDNSASNTETTIRLRPAGGTTLGVLDPTAIGKTGFPQVEVYDDLTIEQAKSLGPIFTSGAAATTSELRNVYPAANHSNTEGPLYMEFENTGDDVVLMKAGTDEFLKITSNQLILDDGTTQVSTACAAGEHKAGIAFSDEDSLMNLNLDGTWADLTDSTAYDGTLGSGDISLGETCRKVKRLNATDFDKQKALIDKEMA